MLKVAFLGPLTSSFAERVHAYLSVPCDFIHTDEKNAVDMLPGVDVLVTLIFTREMGASAKQLRLIQVPGAGLDRIDRAAMPPSVSLSKVHGHETGIAEYVMGAIVELGNVLMTPHVAGWTDGMLEARAKMIAENIGRTARGQAPLNRVA